MFLVAAVSQCSTVAFLSMCTGLPEGFTSRAMSLFHAGDWSFTPELADLIRSLFALSADDESSNFGQVRLDVKSLAFTVWNGLSIDERIELVSLRDGILLGGRRQGRDNPENMTVNVCESGRARKRLRTK